MTGQPPETVALPPRAARLLSRPGPVGHAAAFAALDVAVAGEVSGDEKALAERWGVPLEDVLGVVHLLTLSGAAPVALLVDGTIRLGSPEAASRGAVRRVYDAFVAQREKLIREDGGRPRACPLTPKREKLIARFLDLYGEEMLLAAIEGLRWSDYHRGRGRYELVRLLPEQVFLETSRANQVEILAATRDRHASRPEPPKAKPEPEDGFTFPSGARWSRLYGRPVPAAEWAPWEPPS